MCQIVGLRHARARSPMNEAYLARRTWSRSFIRVRGRFNLPLMHSTGRLVVLSLFTARDEDAVDIPFTQTMRILPRLSRRVSFVGGSLPPTGCTERPRYGKML